MSYDSTVVALAPTDYWPLDETSGSTFRDLGTANLPLTKNGTPVLGAPSLLPGDPSAASVHNIAAAHFASRADASVDHPSGAAALKLSLNVWAQPDLITAAGSQLLFSKPNTYQLLALGTGIRFDVGNVGNSSPGGQYLGPNDYVAPDGRAMYTAVWDGAVDQQRIYRNGLLIGQRTWAEGSMMPWTDTGALLLGGFGAFAIGFQGFVQKPALWVGTALTVAQIRQMYEAGEAGVAEVAGQLGLAFPWARKILDGTSSRERLDLTNLDDVSVSVGIGGPPPVGGGHVLAPRGGRYTTPVLPGAPVETGDVWVVHHGPSGAKRVAVHQQVSS